jgi:hypothetical protein
MSLCGMLQDSVQICVWSQYGGLIQRGFPLQAVLYASKNLNLQTLALQIERTSLDTV